MRRRLYGHDVGGLGHLGVLGRDFDADRYRQIERSRLLRFVYLVDDLPKGGMRRSPTFSLIKDPIHSGQIHLHLHQVLHIVALPVEQALDGFPLVPVALWVRQQFGSSNFS